MGEKAVHSAIAVPAVLLGQFDDVRGQQTLVGNVSQRLALGRAMLAKYRAGPSLGEHETLADLLDAFRATGGN